MSGKRAERRVMASACDLATAKRMEAKRLIRDIAAKGPAQFSVKSALNYVHSKLAQYGWTHNRCKDIWQANERVSVSGAEIDALKQVSKAEENEADCVAAKLARIEQFLGISDPDVYREDIEALRVRIARYRRMADPTE